MMALKQISDPNPLHGDAWVHLAGTLSYSTAAGGFTTVCAMPNTKPVNDTRAISEMIVAKARSHGPGEEAMNAALLATMKAIVRPQAALVEVTTAG